MQNLLAPGELKALRPYLIGEEARANGEWDMFCPLHPDSQRSASLNVSKAEWYCHRCNLGGDVNGLMSRRREWVAPGVNVNGSGPKARSTSGPAGSLSESEVAAWGQALLSGGPPLRSLRKLRGIDKRTAERFEMGWDERAKAYTIPIRDEAGDLTNVRFYTPKPALGRRKIWSVTGHGAAKLFPINQLPEEVLIVCEGELDALLTIQHGFAAITRTGSATSWAGSWRELFRGKTIYLCHDCDSAGEAGNNKVGRALQLVADCYVLKLPYAVTAKHGKDLTDFWMDGHTAADLRQRMEEALPFGDVRTRPEDIPDTSVLGAFDSSKAGKPLRLNVTTKGKKEPGYTVPETYTLDCDRGAGDKCETCPLMSVSGAQTVAIEPSDPVVLKLVDVRERDSENVLRLHYGAVKCPRLEIEVKDFQAVEILYARSSVDRSSGTTDASEYKPIRMVSAGRHDTAANQTVQVTGALHPSPVTQANEFLVWEVDPLETSLDTFELTADLHAAMSIFEPGRGQTPLRKAVEIADELANSVTRIYGLPKLHVAMDLVFHSLLGFTFEGQPIDRGWLELLVVGDTRTGKSEALTKFIEWYGAGELVSCESASFAGVVGGLQQYGGKEWVVSWGAIPTNDRRLVGLDEVGGLSVEEIGQLSSVRSSGIAQLTKIATEQTMARTRLIWLGNPRNGTMAEYTYGVDALLPLIGNNEDVARFDFATSVRTGQVPAEVINRHHARKPTAVYSRASCQALLGWVWSRKPDQVQWAQGAEMGAYRAALDLAGRYVEVPPLVQGANIRKKIARLAGALAARTHSTDATGELVVVQQRHVQDAVRLLDAMYGDEGFGYLERSTEQLADVKLARESSAETIRFLPTRPGLAKFIRSAGRFKKTDLEEVLDVDRDEANSIINTLMKSRMLVRKGPHNVATPILQDILRTYKGD